MADRIVYGQKDLDRTLCEGLKSITLCAGIYDIPVTAGVTFDRLGPVIVSVRGTRREAERAGMMFFDIYPEYRSEYATDERVPLRTVAVSSGSGSYLAGAGIGVVAGSSFGSYAGSGSGIYIFGYGIDLI